MVMEKILAEMLLLAEAGWSGDVEAGHSEADDLLVELCRYLAESLGMGGAEIQDQVVEILEAYGRVAKWYA
jgi:hypothetical protein